MSVIVIPVKMAEFVMMGWVYTPVTVLMAIMGHTVK